MSSSMHNTEINIEEMVQELISKMGFKDFSTSLQEDSKRISIFINDGSFLQKHLASFVSDFDSIIKLILKKRNQEFVHVDINNHKKEREVLIAKLAKAAARKAVATRQIIELPPMNAYERRIIHTELAIHPDLKTESRGEGKHRNVVIYPIT